MNRKRPEKQRIGSTPADLDRPKADCSSHAQRQLARDEGKTLDRTIAFAQPIGRLGVAVEAEGKIEQRFDRGGVGLSLGIEDEWAGCHWEYREKALDQAPAGRSSNKGSEGQSGSNARKTPRKAASSSSKPELSRH
jgi:hypothetical protein